MCFSKIQFISNASIEFQLIITSAGESLEEKEKFRSKIGLLYSFNCSIVMSEDDKRKGV
jgi:hypothetical protein